MYFIVLEPFMKKVSTFVWLDLLHKYDQIFCGEDTKNYKIFLGENPAFAIKYQNVYDQI